MKCDNCKEELIEKAYCQDCWDRKEEELVQELELLKEKVGAYRERIRELEKGE